MIGLLLLACTDYALQPREAEDAWVQTPADAVDLLLVVDDSGSMAPYQQEVADHLDALLRFLELGAVDWQLGVTTTDVAADGGRIREQVITRDTPGAERLFRWAVGVGVHGAGQEQGLEAARLAVSGPLLARENHGLLRPGASLAVLTVSDEDDSSPDAVAAYADALATAAGDPLRTAASALVVLDAPCTPDSTPGLRYLALAEATGGLTLDLCAGDLGPALEDLSLHSSGLAERFRLSALPDVRSLEVWVDDLRLPCGAGTWDLEADGDGVAVVFARQALPPPGATVLARYDLGQPRTRWACAAP